MTQVSLFHPWGTFEQVAEAVGCAEEAGFDGCLFGEHHGGADRPQLLILLAALAARTRTIRLGTSILLSPLYDPVVVAESAAMVDVISNGRLILGVGLGYQPQDFQQFNVPFNQRVSRFEESIEVLRLAWSQERFSYNGRRFQYHDISVHPRPVQQPHPPIWMAAWSIEGAKRAGRLGDAYVTDPIQNFAATTAFAQAYRDSAAANSRASDVVIMREFLCAPTRSEAEDRYGPALVQTYRYYWLNKAFNADFEPWVNEVSNASELDFARLARDRVIWGTPEDCIGQLEAWVTGLGASHVQLAIPPRAAGMSQEAQLETIRFVGEHVLPKLHAI